jgi:hypothetical protein
VILATYIVASVQCELLQHFDRALSVRSFPCLRSPSITRSVVRQPQLQQRAQLSANAPPAPGAIIDSPGNRVNYLTAQKPFAVTERSLPKLTNRRLIYSKATLDANGAAAATCFSGLETSLNRGDGSIIWKVQGGLPEGNRGSQLVIRRSGLATMASVCSSATAESASLGQSTSRKRSVVGSSALGHVWRSSRGLRHSVLGNLQLPGVSTSGSAAASSPDWVNQMEPEVDGVWVCVSCA